MDAPEQPYARPLSDRPVEAPRALVPPRRPLEGHVVRLEPLDPDRHGEELFTAGHGSAEAEAIWDYLPYGPWPDAAAQIAFLRTQAMAFDPIFFAIRPEDGPAQGVASYLEVEPAAGRIEIGHIWFGPALQRTRAATEALALMMLHAMDDLGYRRLQWKCNALNARSRSAARRLGFRFEGILYNHLVVKGRNRDTAYYSILDREWPEVRQALQRWLAPDNFDATGRERIPLSTLMAAR
ncbi:MAG: GNAT family protein [Pseudomonadota bacterium]